MCRFVAYLGRTSLILNEVIRKPAHSLVNQSKHAREGKTGLNADGFGVGWYDHRIDGLPGIYKSVQPAWNDFNLKHMLTKLSSTCFIAHVRASTVGDVGKFNCHPYMNKNFLFAHNGTIRGFREIKRELRKTLSDEAFDIIRGHTDSEHFFALLNDYWSSDATSCQVSQLSDAMTKALAKIASMRKQFSVPKHSTINCAFTDGINMVATRYSSDSNKRPPSLHYSFRAADGSAAGDAPADGVIIASEPLTDLVDAWHEVLENQMVIVDSELNVSLRPIEF